MTAYPSRGQGALCDSSHFDLEMHETELTRYFDPRHHLCLPDMSETGTNGAMRF